MTPEHTPRPKHTTQPILPSVTNTPVKAGLASMLHFSTLLCCCHTTIHMLGDEIKGYLIGPMHAHMFLDEFLPKVKLPGYSNINFTPGAFQSTLTATSELDAYQPFVKLDLSIYSDNYSIGCGCSTIEISIKFKWDASLDTFNDLFIKEHLDIPSFIHPTKSVKDTLGQITTYTSTQLGSQYHTHAFSVLIIQDTAHIIRWDQEGAIVTTPIKYGEDQTLAEFFSHYSQASPELCGIDTTVTEASAAEAHQAREQLDLQPMVHMLKTSIPCDVSTLLLLIFPAPTPQGYPPVGHATQAYAAYEWHSHKKFFLKDSWHINLDSILSEGEMYRRLNCAGVHNVPTCLAFMDVPSTAEQKTQPV
ncbi:hypothetical protein F5141DRAFT_1067714 [Pisolithus sp. B1]|nr:hypothetical protein F5141DRAFT_1067714 [Pisolithus sp. B1]